MFVDRQHAWAFAAVSLVKAARSVPRSGSALTTVSEDTLGRKGVKHGFLCLTPWRQVAVSPWLPLVEALPVPSCPRGRGAGVPPGVAPTAREGVGDGPCSTSHRFHVYSTWNHIEPHREVFV